MHQLSVKSMQLPLITVSKLGIRMKIYQNTCVDFKLGYVRCKIVRNRILCKDISVRFVHQKSHEQWRTQDFSMWGGGSVTSHRDVVKILHCNYNSLEVLKCIVW